VLDVGCSTVYRWSATGNEPRAACLALFWLTRWGRSQVHTQATNDAATAVGLAQALARERAALLARVADLEVECQRAALGVRAAPIPPPWTRVRSGVEFALRVAAAQLARPGRLGRGARLVERVTQAAVQPPQLLGALDRGQHLLRLQHQHERVAERLFLSHGGGPHGIDDASMVAANGVRRRVRPAPCGVSAGFRHESPGGSMRRPAVPSADRYRRHRINELPDLLQVDSRNWASL
jgi:hypothetical protein